MSDQNDYFVAMTEFHFMNLQTMSEIGYYPQMQRFGKSVSGVLKAWAGRSLDDEWPQPLASAHNPLGVFERTPFAAGTLAIAHAVAENRRCLSVVGGGDSAAAIAKANIGDQISHVSTGGGASLEFIQGVKLPGIEALDD